MCVQNECFKFNFNAFYRNISIVIKILGINMYYFITGNKKMLLVQILDL